MYIRLTNIQTFKLRVQRGKRTYHLYLQLLLYCIQPLSLLKNLTENVILYIPLLHAAMQET